MLTQGNQKLGSRLNRHSAVIRLHVGGDFCSAEYTRRWASIARQASSLPFYAYTRVWRVEAIRPALEELADLANVRLWYSCDAETGLPTFVPPRVRLAWLATAKDDLPPPTSDLVFRVHRLRRQPARWPAQGGSQP